MIAMVLVVGVVVADSGLSPKIIRMAVGQGALPVVLPDPNGRDLGRAINAGVIPLGRTRIYVPILMYHYVQDLPAKTDQLTYNLSVTPENFSLQMQWLATHGYHTVTFDDLRAYFEGRQALPSRPVVVTLDDGYRDLYTAAYPILERFGLKAVAYIVTSFVGRPRYVTSDMILEMDRYGIQIASHTVDHPNLSRELEPEVVYETVEAKQWLENLLGHPVLDLAYPSGKFNLLDMEVLHDHGYSTATTEQDGTSRTWATRYAWPRTRVSGGETLSTFIKDLGPVEPFVIVAPTTA